MKRLTMDDLVKFGACRRTLVAFTERYGEDGTFLFPPRNTQHEQAELDYWSKRLGLSDVLYFTERLSRRNFVRWTTFTDRVTPLLRDYASEMTYVSGDRGRIFHSVDRTGQLMRDVLRAFRDWVELHFDEGGEWREVEG